MEMLMMTLRRRRRTNDDCALNEKIILKDAHKP
jgi:hypothetical protein